MQRLIALSRRAPHRRWLVRAPLFDTLAASRGLTDAGLSRGQADATVRCVADAMDKAEAHRQDEWQRRRAELKDEIEQLERVHDLELKAQLANLEQREADLELEMRTSINKAEKGLLSRILEEEAKNHSLMRNKDKSVRDMNDATAKWNKETFRDFNTRINELQHRHLQFQLQMYGAGLTVLVGAIGIGYQVWANRDYIEHVLDSRPDSALPAQRAAGSAAGKDNGSLLPVAARKEG